ncbi:Putative LOC100870303 [Caligus rogercresseyi]|uniref:LOC100870303 n=1 Tax=Caligus rogercresseyi TaxID=217165 RepID=A0A7T8KI75_CALRO|nr:Putative LOC100870303 [Caligus rogercresseyi]
MAKILILALAVAAVAGESPYAPASPIYPDTAPAYNYRYGVNAPEYGPIFSQEENRNDYNTAGEYRVNFPTVEFKLCPTPLIATAMSLIVKPAPYRPVYRPAYQPALTNLSQLPLPPQQPSSSCPNTTYAPPAAPSYAPVYRPAYQPAPIALPITQKDLQLQAHN